ncbi:uncharacterized protein Z518_07653 [Rhinocladiella mackenziei CBS 650.93]|uniref:Rhinocladiella mackenziei CBS 650.93 unplaced genomic scaffold supercont1.5, whole genome shotgun sequence n=1 Tax=Rhinocladiella mackenziei CBS 650.93 TaxID=1442369 RepID=A0A0D2J524_9EURO|nr:uncharacterized protein Z518_07653 [Rhinocladiella mackenziei CBS 650.93]KIX04100.1 hypothetical protein Z518_07653 [Rhinocladiella mackenziei CBS 650.93]
MAPSKKRSRKGSSKSPKKTRKGMAQTAEPSGFNDEDYNIRSSERTELLTQIKEVFDGAPVSSTFWACCQLADINRLRVIAETDREIVIHFERSTYFIPLQWTQKLRDSNFGEPEAASERPKEPKSPKLNSGTKSSVSRSAKEVNNCKERDDHRCVLTRKPDPQAAHTFPYCMLNPRSTADRNKTSNGIPEFWQSLRLFWDRDRIDKWKSTIFQDPQNPYTGIDKCFNLLSLSSETHNMWNKGIFALKPLQLSSDRKTLTVQLFWQVPTKYEIDSRIDLLTEPKSTKDLDFVEGYFLPRIHDDGLTRHDIRSGEVFTFTTKDPERLPLPSVELLEMQWFLQRLVGMSGAARWPILDFDNDESDDDNGWFVPDLTSDVDNSLERVCEWVATREAAGITPETTTPNPSIVPCY